MEQIISGLLIQKASSRPPEPGEERWFSWETKQGKSGKPYIKIKNDTEEYGGKLCSIIDAEKTDFVDKHGNVSYNVGFEPVNPNGEPLKASEIRKIMREPKGPPVTHLMETDRDFIPMTHGSKGEALPGVDEAKRHIMRAVNLYCLCTDAVDAVIKPHIEGMTADLYQAAIGTLFIEASRSGFVAAMPEKPLPGATKSKQSDSTPF